MGLVLVLLLYVLIVVVVALVLYWIVRKAVAHGIADAHAASLRSGVAQQRDLG